MVTLLFHDLLHNIGLLVLQSLVRHDLLMAPLRTNLALLYILPFSKSACLEGIPPFR